MANRKKMIKRKIRFATVTLTREKHPLDVFDLFHKIDALDFESGARYCKSEDRNLVVIIDDMSSVIKGVMGDSRKEDLPILETAGKTRPLNIPQDAGLLDCNHFVIFKNKYNVPIIAYEANRYAIHMSRLSQYVMTKFPNTMCSFDWIYRGDDLKTIVNSIKELKSIEIRAHSTCDFALLDPSIADAFNALHEISNATYITIKLDCGREKNTLRKNYLDNIDSLINDQNVRSLLESFKIKHINNDTRRVEMIDLLDLFLNEEVEVEQWDSNHKAVNKDSMYSRIEESIQKHKALLDSIQ